MVEGATAESLTQQRISNMSASLANSREACQHHQTSRRCRMWVDRCGIISLILLTLSSYPTLAPKLADNRGGSTLMFHLSFAILIVGLSALAWLCPDTGRVIYAIARRYPIRAVLLTVNVFVTIVLVVNVLTKPGLLLLLGLAAACVLCLSILPRPFVTRTLVSFICYSPISFAAVYTALVGGEILLRLHPRAVGGGGGGNPALRQIYRGLYTKNQLGLRGREISRTPPEGVKRILLVGDSFTFGQGVNDHDTLARCLERSLNNAAPGFSYEVVNAGRSDTNMSDHVMFLREVGLQLEPRIVVVQFYLNDLEAKSRHTVDEGPLESLLTQMVRRSYVLFALRYRFENLSPKRPGLFSKPCPAARWLDTLNQQIHEDGPGWQSFCVAIDELAELSRHQDLPIYVVLYPHPGLELPGMGKIHQAVRQRTAAVGLPTVDLIDVGTMLDPSEQVVSDMDHHPSGAMHRLAAQRIADTLGRDGH